MTRDWFEDDEWPGNYRPGVMPARETETDTIPSERGNESAEWRALHARAEELADLHREAERMAGAWLVWGIEHPESAERAQMRAVEEARKSLALWIERAAAVYEANAHPNATKRIATKWRLSKDDTP